MSNFTIKGSPEVVLPLFSLKKIKLKDIHFEHDFRPFKIMIMISHLAHGCISHYTKVSNNI